MKWTKRIAAVLSMVIAINTVTIGAASANNSPAVEEVPFGHTVEQSYVQDQHDLEMLAAFKAAAKNEALHEDSFNAQPAIVGPIVRLATLIFRNVTKGAKVTVKATARNVVTEVSAHAVERGISGLQMFCPKNQLECSQLRNTMIQTILTLVLCWIETIKW